MKPIFARGNHNTIKKLVRLKKQAENDSATRVAFRIQAILLSLEGHTTGQIAHLLHISRGTVPLWIHNWNTYQETGLLEGHRCGRARQLSSADWEKLADIIESGPVAYGLSTGVWTSVIITSIIEEEFGVRYHPGHVRKLLKQLGFSVQRPTIQLVNADPQQQNKWIRYTYPNLKKTPKKNER
jgi:transposase